MTAKPLPSNAAPAGAQSNAKAKHRGAQRRNWPLWVGLVLVALFVLAALIGPWVAPHDPMARVAVLNINGQWVGPPFPALSPGFLLGSDRAGRDLFSRLLWAIRPTLALVGIIAVVRLALGLVVGVTAGYGADWGARVAAALTRAALAVPVLVVALAAIAFIGIQRGLIAFLIGLCLTGWAESARYVEVRTRAVKMQPFMESAQAMGAQPPHQLLYHVLRHVLPTAAMLFAQEVSGVLMAVAALGFLGYYIGGGAWLTVEDFVARSTAGMPELGQMLATSTERLFDLWPMLVVGGVVVLVIFGFSLLGEGLRRQLEGEVAGRTGPLDRTLTTLTSWADGGLLTTPTARRRALAAAATAVVLLAVVLGANWWLGRANAEEPAAGFALDPPGGPQWSGQRHDAYGTLEIAAAGPVSPTLLWSYEHKGGFTAGPAVGADGTVYVAGKDTVVLALDASGKVRQQWTLPAAPVGSPALGKDGTVYVVDAGPGLSALAPDGAVRWRFTSQGRRPTSGPIVAPDGTIYFSRLDYIQAVNPNGSERWLAGPVENEQELPPRLSPDGSLVYLGTTMYNTADGKPATPLPMKDELKFQIPFYATGGDGGTYLLAGNTAVRWKLAGGQPQADQAISWNLGGLNIYLPTDEGIAANGDFWLFYGGNNANARMIWLDTAGRTRADIQTSLGSSRLIGIDGQQRAYACAAVSGTLCGALDRDKKAEAWNLRVPNGLQAVGGALAPGRLYVTTGDGWIHALGDK